MTKTNEKLYLWLRVCYAEAIAEKQGALSRDDLVAAFGICRAKASNDIQELLRLHPGCLDYDLSKKTYFWTGNGRKLVLGPQVEKLIKVLNG